VGIIGCGGIGSGIISNLVSYGVKNFILMDPDVVEPSNITRQPLFSLQDLSKQKTEVLRSFIKNRVKNASVETYNKKFELEDDLKYFEDVDILIFAADSSNFKDILSDNITTPENILEKFSYRKNIPLAYCGGYKGFTGRVLPIVIPGVTHSLHCILHDIIQTNENSNFDFVLDLNHNTEITLSTIPETCKVISSIMSFEIIKYLSGILPLSLVNKIIFVEFKNYSLSQSEISLNENHTCLCGLSP
jgi:molybdopterin/thiamine biosynthesis adenylyltransferase